MTGKQIFDARSTMKNWTSYVLNTVSSRGHEGWRGLKFGENLSARIPRSGPRWQVFTELQHSPNLSDHD